MLTSAIVVFGSSQKEDILRKKQTSTCCTAVLQKEGLMYRTIQSFVALWILAHRC